MAALIQCVCVSYLQTTLGKSYTSFSQFHFKTILSASANLLNLLCTQLSNLYDEEKKKGDAAIVFHVQHLLGNCLGIATEHIASASTSYSGDISKVIAIESRDGCYDVICTVCRSLAALDNPSIVFESRSRIQQAPVAPSDMSTSHPSSTSATALNFSLAHTLFGCVIYEDQALRLRAMAALDALLSAAVKAIKLVDAIEVDTPKPAFLLSAARSLLPCIWKAAKQKSSKLSRMSAVSWAKDFISYVDDISACHVLCFLAGDDDDSVSATACQAIGFERILDVDHYLSPFASQRPQIHPAFSLIVEELFPTQRRENGKPVFADFIPKSREVSLHFCLLCYQMNCCSSDDISMTAFYTTLTTTLSTSTITTNMGKDVLDLMDAASAVLSELLRSSKIARKLAVGKDTTYGFASILDTMYRLQSMSGQLHLASGIFYCLLIDFDLWTAQISLDEWKRNVHFEEVLKKCLSNLNNEGAIYIAAYYLRAFRTFHLMYSSSSESSWILCVRILGAFCEAVLHTEDSIAIACITSLGIALSHTDYGSDISISSIHVNELVRGKDQMTLFGISVLGKLNEGFSRAANASNRLYALIKAVDLIFRGISPIDMETERPIISSLFNLLSNRNVYQDPLLALTVGECLFNSTSSNFVAQRLMDVEVKTTVYQTRNSLSLCLLAFLTVALKSVSICLTKCIIFQIVFNR